MSVLWRKDEEEYLANNWPYKTAVQIAKEMSRTPRAVQYKAWRMDLPRHRIVHHTTACSYRIALPTDEWYKVINFLKILAYLKKNGAKRVDLEAIQDMMAELERRAC